MSNGPIVQILNRAPFPLRVMKDGRQYEIPLGKSYVTEDVVLYARNQNPIPGTEDPSSLAYESLVSVVAPNPKDQKHPLDLVDQETLDAMPKERIDRSLLAPDRQSNVKQISTSFPRGRVGVDRLTDNMLDPSGAIHQ